MPWGGYQRVADRPLARFARIGFCPTCRCHRKAELSHEGDDRRAECPEGHGPLSPPLFPLPKAPATPPPLAW